MLLGWGPHRFEVGRLAYDQLRQRTAGRWKDHDIIGRRPAGQFMGPAAEPLHLKGVVFPADARDTTAKIAALQAACREGRVYSLIAGNGEVFGPHRLEQVSREETYHDGKGTAGRIGFDLEFKSHDDADERIWSVWP